MVAGEKPKKKEKQHRQPELEDDDDQRAMSRRKKKQKLHPIATADQKEDGTVRADQDDEKGIKGKKKKKKKHQKQQQNHGDEQKNATITDARFVGAHSDPRFQRMPRHESKVRIDSRFTRMFTDKSFARSSAPVDKRGKPHKGKPVNPLLHHYLHQDDDVDDDEAEENPVNVGAEIEFDDIRSDTEEHESSVGDDLSSLGNDDDNDVDDEDDDQGSVRSDIVQYLMANHKDTPMLDHATHRLAVVNMDWEHIKAVDIYVVMTSCLPKGGQILSVAIYPSEFGLKCMEVEAVHGPSALICEDSEQSEDDSEIDNEKARSYELNKLRYYYAVVVCDSSATANNIYKTLDGTELLKTSNVFDLRFVPDSMEFMHPPREIMKEAPTSYKEPDFQTRALQHSKVDLTWEKEEPNRKKMLGRKFNPNQVDELKEYLASSGESDDDSGDSDAGEEEKRLSRKREKLRSLLQEPNDDPDSDHSEDKDMEVTFNTELEDISKRILEKQDNKSKTVWEAVVQKRSEKRKSRRQRSKHSSEDSDAQEDDFFLEETICKGSDKSRAGGERNQVRNREEEASRDELELLFAGEHGDDGGPKGYNLKRKKGKGKKDDDKPANVDCATDPRFSALFTSHLYALDPTDPQFKRSATYARQRTRSKEEDNLNAMNPSDDKDEECIPVRLSASEKERHELSATVRSLKRKLVTVKDKPKIPF